jgi:ankyrin repeat protein
MDPLNTAVTNGDLVLVTNLLDPCMQIYQQHYDRNPLDLACKGMNPNGDYEGIIRLLLDRYPDLIDHSNGHGNTPLTTALCNMKPRLAQILLDHGANVDFYNQQDCHIFCSAVYCGDPQIINNILARLPYPSHISAECGYAGYFNETMCHELNDCGDTVLHSAVHGEQKELVELFILQGYDLNAKNDEGATPLHYASNLYHSTIPEILLKAGADPNIKDDTGRTPLFNSSYDLKNFELLLDYGAESHITNNDGLTVVQWLRLIHYDPPLHIIEFLENYVELPLIKGADN